MGHHDAGPGEHLGQRSRVNGQGVDQGDPVTAFEAGSRQATWTSARRGQ